METYLLISYMPLKQYYSENQHKRRSLSLRTSVTNDVQEESVTFSISVSLSDSIGEADISTIIFDKRLELSKRVFMEPDLRAKEWCGWLAKIDGLCAGVIFSRAGEHSRMIYAREKKKVQSFFIMRSKLYYLTKNRHLFSVNLNDFFKEGNKEITEQEFPGNIIFDAIGHKKLRKLIWCDGQKVYLQNELLFKNEFDAKSFHLRLKCFGDYLVISAFKGCLINHVYLMQPESKRMVLSEPLNLPKHTNKAPFDNLYRLKSLTIALIPTNTRLKIMSIRGDHSFKISDISIMMDNEKTDKYVISDMNVDISRYRLTIDTRHRHKISND